MKILTKFNDYDMTPVKTERWYDRATRCWVVQTLTVDGFQVGDATYVHGKGEAIRDEQRRKAEIEEAR